MGIRRAAHNRIKAQGNTSSLAAGGTVKGQKVHAFKDGAAMGDTSVQALCGSYVRKVADDLRAVTCAHCLDIAEATARARGWKDSAHGFSLYWVASAARWVSIPDRD